MTRKSATLRAMKAPTFALTALIVSTLALSAADGPKPHAMDELIIKSKSALELLQASEKSIPAQVLEKAQGLAIANVTRGGILIGGQSGEGIVVQKVEDGWSAPSAFDTGGGSVGAQIGLENVDFILVLNTPTAVQLFTADDVSLDAKASATAGPDRAAAAAEKLPASDIYVYAMSDGAFAGATVGGMFVSVDTDLNNEVYSNLVTVQQILSGEASPPAAAKGLYALLPE